MKDSIWKSWKIPSSEFKPSDKRLDYFGATHKDKGLKDQRPTAGTVRPSPWHYHAPKPQSYKGFCGGGDHKDSSQGYDVDHCNGGKSITLFSRLSRFSTRYQVKPTVALSANGPPKCRVMLMLTVKVPRLHEAFSHFYAAAHNILLTLSVTNMASKGPVSCLPYHPRITRC